MPNPEQNTPNSEHILGLLAEAHGCNNADETAREAAQKELLRTGFYAGQVVVTSLANQSFED